MSTIDARTVGVALAIDFGIGLACFAIFSILRIIKPTNKYYEPRTYYHSRTQMNRATSSSSSGPMPQPAAAAGHDDLGRSDPHPFRRNSSSSSRQVALQIAAAGSSSLEMHGMPRPGMPLPPTLPRTLLTWLWPLLRLSEARVIAAVGLDVAMLLRFIRFATRLLLIIIIWCVGVVLPVNFSGHFLSNRNNAAIAAAQQFALNNPAAVFNNTSNQQSSFLNKLFPRIAVPSQFSFVPSSPAPGNSTSGARAAQLGPGVDIGSLATRIEQGLYEYSNLDLFSMANIPTGSQLLWVHLASVYLVTVITLRMLWSATSSALSVYLAHLASSSANLDSASHTALVTDIPGIPRGTMMDKVLHNSLFRLLLPPGVKRRLKATWASTYFGQSMRRKRAKRNRNTTTVERGEYAANDTQQHDQCMSGQQQQQRQQGRLDPTLASNSSAAAAGGRRSSSGVYVDIPRAATDTVDSNHADLHQQQQQQQQQEYPGDSDHESPQYLPSHPFSDSMTTASSSGSSIRRRSLAAAAAAGVNSSSSTARSRLGHPSNSQAAAAAAGASPGSPSQAAAAAAAGGSSALSAALRAQSDVGVGGVGVFSSEWQKAAKKLAAGVTLKDFILHEFQTVYGADNVVACHPVTWTPKAAALVQQYNTTRTALEDLLTSYAEQLTAAAAAAKGGPRRQQHMKPVKIRKLKYPSGKAPPTADQHDKKHHHHQQQQQQQIEPPSQSKAAQLVKNNNHSSSSSSGGGNFGGNPHHIMIMTSISIPDSTRSVTPQTSSAGNAAAAAAGPNNRDAFIQQQESLSAAAAANQAAAAAVSDTMSGFCCWGRQPGISGGSSSSSSTGQAISSSKALTALDGGGSDGGVMGWLRCGCLRRKVSGDALDVLLWRLESLKYQLVVVQREAEEDPSPSAFVTFRSRTVLTAAISAHHVAEAGAWKVCPAPSPDSLIWGKLSLRFWELGMRRGLVLTTLCLLAVSYVVPVTIIQGLLQLDRLEKFPVIGVLVKLPVVQSLLVGVLPGLALRIFVMLLPVILYVLDRRAGAKGDAELDGSVATHFFSLQVVVVFLASFISGSLLNQLQLFVTNGLGPIFDRLGAGVPQTASFFILYIIFTAFIGRSWGLLRPWGLLMTSIRSLSARKNGSNARRRAVVVGTYRMFGPTVPEHSIILLLGLVFSVIAPLVLVAALIFFAMSLPVSTYNWVWVFRRPYEGGGRLWKQLFRHVFIALYLFQIVMAALFIVKRFVWTPLIIPAFLITLLVHHVGSRLLQRSWDVLSMKAAHQLDLDDQQDAVDLLTEQNKLRQGGAASAVTVHGNPHSEQQQQQVEEDIGVVDIDPDELEAVYRSQALSWSEMYRPPAVQLLDQAEAVQSGLRQRVAAMHARLAAHNTAAEAAAALRKQQKHRTNHKQQQQQKGPEVPV